LFNGTDQPRFWGGHVKRDLSRGKLTETIVRKQEKRREWLQGQELDRGK